VEAGTYAGDVDIQEQFHNFLLHESECPYTGVELLPDLVKEFKDALPPVEKLMRFNRLVFGCSSSPYLALQMHTRGIELAKDDPSETSSAFHWSTIELNLPGMPTYNPALP
jgi:hypothetical protein